VFEQRRQAPSLKVNGAERTRDEPILRFQGSEVLRCEAVERLDDFGGVAGDQALVRAPQAIRALLPAQPLETRRCAAALRRGGVGRGERDNDDDDNSKMLSHTTSGAAFEPRSSDAWSPPTAGDLQTKSPTGTATRRIIR
jgi:hypothetical protein